MNFKEILNSTALVFSAIFVPLFFGRLIWLTYHFKNKKHKLEEGLTPIFHDNSCGLHTKFAQGFKSTYRLTAYEEFFIVSGSVKIIIYWEDIIKFEPNILLIFISVDIWVDMGVEIKKIQIATNKRYQFIELLNQKIKENELVQRKGRSNYYKHFSMLKDERI